MNAVEKLRECGIAVRTGSLASILAQHAEWQSEPYVALYGYPTTVPATLVHPSNPAVRVFPGAPTDEDVRRLIRQNYPWVGIITDHANVGL